MVGLVEPGLEQPVELLQRREIAPFELDDEPFPHRAEEPLDLAAALGPSGLGVDEPDAEHRADPL